jgi:hypothetical protein
MEGQQASAVEVELYLEQGAAVRVLAVRVEWARF